MITSKNLLDEIHTFFPAKERDIRTFSPLALAYLGDAVFEIIIRTLVTEKAKGPVKKFHAKTSSVVNAKSQAALITSLLDELTEEEMAFFRHGRNAKTSSVAKNADIHDYRNATGLETLYGYLYLTGQMERAMELLEHAMQKTNIII